MCVSVRDGGQGQKRNRENRKEKKRKEFNCYGVSIYESVLSIFSSTSSFLNQALLSVLALGHYETKWRGFQQLTCWIWNHNRWTSQSSAAWSEAAGDLLKGDIW